MCDEDQSCLSHLPSPFHLLILHFHWIFQLQFNPLIWQNPPPIWPECTANPNEKACANVSSGGLLHTDLVGQIINTELRLRLLGVYSGPAPINT